MQVLAAFSPFFVPEISNAFKVGWRNCFWFENCCKWPKQNNFEKSRKQVRTFDPFSCHFARAASDSVNYARYSSECCTYRFWLIQFERKQLEEQISRQRNVVDSLLGCPSLNSWCGFGVLTSANGKWQPYFQRHCVSGDLTAAVFGIISTVLSVFKGHVHWNRWDSLNFQMGFPISFLNLDWLLSFLFVEKHMEVPGSPYPQHPPDPPLFTRTLVVIRVC